MSEPAHIGDLVKKEKAQLWKRSPQLALQALWRKAVGDNIAANTSVLSLRRGVLTVNCSSSGWACELKLAGDDLTRRLNALRPPGKVDEIRFVHGSPEP